MIIHVVCVRDRSADCFGQPTFTPRIGLAIRSFADQINSKDPNNVLSKHPVDFDLFELGTYDDSTAQFDLYDRPRQIAVGKDLIREE